MHIKELLTTATPCENVCYRINTQKNNVVLAYSGFGVFIICVTLQRTVEPEAAQYTKYGYDIRKPQPRVPEHGSGQRIRSCRNWRKLRYSQQENLGRNSGHKLWRNHVITAIFFKQSHYRPWEALWVPGRRGSKISRQSAHDSGKVVSPRHRPPLLSGNISGTHFC